MIRAVMVCATLALTACSGPARVAWTPPETASAEDDAKCRQFGAAPGTPQYTDCRLQLDAQRGQMKAAYGRQVAAGFASAGQSLDNQADRVAMMSAANSASYAQNNTFRSTPVAVQLSEPITCTSQNTIGLGNPRVTQCR